MLARRLTVGVNATVRVPRANFTCIAQACEKIQSKYTIISDQAITMWDAAPVCVQSTAKIVAMFGCVGVVGFVWTAGTLGLFMWNLNRYEQGVRRSSHHQRGKKE